MLVTLDCQLDRAFAVAIGVIDKLRGDALRIGEHFGRESIEVPLELATGDRAAGGIPWDRHAQHRAPLS
jgi:hypothetical protein